MKQRSVLLFFVFAFWTIFFVVARGIFLIYFSDARADLSFSEILAIFERGITMDLSAAAYASAFTGILLAVLYFRTGIQLWPLWIMVHTAAVLAAAFAIVADLALYPSWHYRLDIRALTGSNGEAIGLGPVDVIVLLIIFLVLIGAGIYLSYRIFWRRFYALRATSLATLPVILGFTALLIIPMRGSLYVATMNTSFAYSHPTKAFANHAGVNAVWNFAHSLTWPSDDRMASLRQGSPQLTHAAPDSSALLVSHQKPNVIIILLDRFPADMVGALGGRADVTPQFNKLVKEGILFDKFYSNSDRMGTGLSAILNGYPSSSRVSTMTDARRAQTLPFLNQVFKAQGYTTGFTFGGWPDYDNLRAYLFSARFDSVTNANHFVSARRTSKWGVPDEFVFEKFSDEVFRERQPFFRVLMTQSTRKPYDAPMAVVFKGQDEQTQFMNAVHYTDQWLGNFIEKAKKTLWWQNTLILITADQGGAEHEDATGVTPAQFRIPMLWLGGAINKSDTVIHTLGNQTDICNTLLAQLGQRSSDFTFSRDLLSTNSDQQAMFVFDQGFGIVKTYGAGIFENAGKVIYSERVNEREAEQGRAYLQAVLADYAAR